MAAPISSPQTTSNPSGSWGANYTPPGGYSTYNEQTGNYETYDKNGVRIGESTQSDVAARSNEPIIRSADDPVIKQEVALADNIRSSNISEQQAANMENAVKQNLPSNIDVKVLTESGNVPNGTDPNVNTNNTNPNGDPNPNAVITPPSANQPSNLKVANVNVTPVTDTGDELDRLAARYPAPAAVTPQKTPSGKDDWRVKLSLAAKADYLYKDPGIKSTHIMFPLVETDGVIFPYTPQIQINYRANYQNVDITHTNYKNHFFVNSSVDEISITADFTAQDNVEAQYMLATIHFFRSVTKMFYGQDTDPRGGTPPPLCFLTGLGSFQFENNPLVITGFNYTLPNDVDYIRADTSTVYTAGGIPIQKPPATNKKPNIFTKFLSSTRLLNSNLNKQAKPSQPNFQSITNTEQSITYVPSKIQIQLSCLPMVSRDNVSNKFKLNGKDGYGSGQLISKGFW